jgi:hypothetical protein
MTQRVSRYLRHGRPVIALLLAIWLACLGVELLALFRFSENIPYLEDWHVVRPLTGHEPSLARWLWAQNNEHRYVFSRFLLLLVTRAAGGDLRAAMLCNIALLALVSLALMFAVQKARGRPAWTDLIIPLTFLSLGHASNVYWAWQITYIVPVCIASLFLAAIIIDPELSSRRVAIAAAIAVALLPLNGGVGLLFVPAISGWMVCLFLRSSLRRGHRGAALILAGGLFVSGVLCLLYFAGYVPSSWRGRPPEAALWGTALLRFFSLAFGPAARRVPFASIPAAASLIVLTVIFFGRDLWGGFRGTPLAATATRLRSCGIFAVASACVFYGVAFAFARARLIEEHFHGVPAQYALPSAPLLIAIYAWWSLAGVSSTLKCVLPVGMCLGSVALFPWNTADGLKWLAEHHAPLSRARQIAEQGPSPEGFASKTARDLFNLDSNEEYAKRVGYLQEKGIQPFRTPASRLVERGQLRAAELPTTCATPAPASSDVVETRVEIGVPGAGKVELLWGINGWNCVPVEQAHGREGQLSKSLLVRASPDPSRFGGVLRVPRGSTINFAIRAYPAVNSSNVLWREYQTNAQPVISYRSLYGFDAEGRVLYTGSSRLQHREVRVVGAGEVKEILLYWGIGDVWAVLDPSLQPRWTTLLESNMVFRMLAGNDPKQGRMFTAPVAIPEGSRLSCGVLVTHAGSGFLQLQDPIWRDCPPDVPDAAIRLPGNLVGDEIGRYVPDGRRTVALSVGFMILWITLWVLDGVVQSMRRPGETHISAQGY